MRQVRSLCYLIARLLGDLLAVSSGSPARVLRRTKNKVLGRQVWRLWQ